MSKTQHKHNPEHQQHPAPKSAWHKDWRTWVVVGLMLAAMAVYVFSVDESVDPGANEGGTEEPISAP